MNVGLGHDWTVNEYYAAAAKVVGYSGGFYHDTTKPIGMKQKQVSVEQALLWGWSAKTALEEGLAQTYAYYLRERDGQSI
ncbi:MAG: NAD-dependent epimerase [Magnetococcales bacterium]|nr:NAD-dependent epimerase [Magnetococcales bacterium]